MTVSEDPGASQQSGATETLNDVKDTAQSSAQDVASTAKDEAKQVVDTAKEQVQAVTSDVKEQGKKLVDETRGQLTEQAGAQRDRVAENLRSLADELSNMAEGSQSDGLARQLVREGGDYARQAAEFLEGREPGQLLDDVRSLARRRPGAFLIGAAVAGMVVGRATRGMKKAHSSSTGSSDAEGTSALPSYAREDDVSFASTPTLGAPVGAGDAWVPGSTGYPADEPISTGYPAGESGEPFSPLAGGPAGLTPRGGGMP